MVTYLLSRSFSDRDCIVCSVVQFDCCGCVLYWVSYQSPLRRSGRTGCEDQNFKINVNDKLNRCAYSDYYLTKSDFTEVITYSRHCIRTTTSFCYNSSNFKIIENGQRLYSVWETSSQVFHLQDIFTRVSLVNNYRNVRGKKHSSLISCILFCVRFPSFPKRRQIWLKQCKLAHKEVLPNSKICSFHFEPRCFKSGLKRHVLYPDAVPTIFGNDHEKTTNLPLKIVKGTIHFSYFNYLMWVNDYQYYKLSFCPNGCRCTWDLYTDSNL